jgi:hypothetical protein
MSARLAPTDSLPMEAAAPRDLSLPGTVELLAGLLQECKNEGKAGTLGLALNHANEAIILLQDALIRSGKWPRFVCPSCHGDLRTEIQGDTDRVIRWSCDNVSCAWHNFNGQTVVPALLLVNGG